jgi:oligopeptidase B
VLTAYGAYGAFEEDTYNPLWPVLLDKGYVLAVAHVRGGGALGVPWQAAGQQKGKQKGVEDLLACAQALPQYLLDPPPSRLTAVAASAGGTILANALHQVPHLFDDVVLSNAFLDVYDTLCDSSLPLTKHEWDKFGNPLESEETAAMVQDYCPVQTAKDVHHVPRMLLMAAKQDKAVPYTHTTKYAEQICRHLSPQEAEKVVVWLEDDVGHDWGHKRLHVASLQAAFLLMANDE